VDSQIIFRLSRRTNVDTDPAVLAMVPCRSIADVFEILTVSTFKATRLPCGPL
jgi:hypothetical protein